MCTGVEIALIVAAVGAAYAGNEQAKAAQDSADAQATELNMAAGAEQDAAAARAEQIRKAARRQRAEAKTAYSASGVSSEAGTPIVIDKQIATGGESDALMTILGANRNATSAQRQGIAFGKQGKDQADAIRTQTAASVLQLGASSASASGWRSKGPGFSGTQAPAPITTAQPVRING